MVGSVSAGQCVTTFIHFHLLYFGITITQNNHDSKYYYRELVRAVVSA